MNPLQLAKSYPWIARLYPFLFTTKLGVTADVMQDVRRALGTSTSFEDLAKTYRERHHIAYMDARISYLQHAASMRHAGKVSIVESLRGKSHALTSVPDFGSFDDPLGYNGKSPEAAYLIGLALVVAARLNNHNTTRMMMVTGDTLRGDMTFKLAKKCFADGYRPYESVFTVMNEYNEVAGTWACRTKSLDQVADALRALSRRYALWPELARQAVQAAAAGAAGAARAGSAGSLDEPGDATNAAPPPVWLAGLGAQSALQRQGPQAVVYGFVLPGGGAAVGHIPRLTGAGARVRRERAVAPQPLTTYHLRLHQHGGAEHDGVRAAERRDGAGL